MPANQNRGFELWRHDRRAPRLPDAVEAPHGADNDVRAIDLVDMESGEYKDMLGHVKLAVPVQKTAVVCLRHLSCKQEKQIHGIAHSGVLRRSDDRNFYERSCPHASSPSHIRTSPRSSRWTIANRLLAWDAARRCRRLHPQRCGSAPSMRTPSLTSRPWLRTSWSSSRGPAAQPWQSRAAVMSLGSCGLTWVSRLSVRRRLNGQEMRTVSTAGVSTSISTRAWTISCACAPPALHVCRRLTRGHWPTQAHACA